VPRIPHGQGRVALLQSIPLRLKGLKPREDDLEPRTLGEHIRKRRLGLGLNKKDTGRRLGVTAATITNWEKCETKPVVEHFPAILEFLGYSPFPEPQNVAEALAAKRRACGWTIRRAAAGIGVDPTSWGDWEHGKVILFRSHRKLVARLLGLREIDIMSAMASRWTSYHRGDRGSERTPSRRGRRS